jgi:peptide-methionine (S)-S-oxide reductase
VEVEFDPAVTDYPALLALFWSGHDPTVPAYSRQYMSAIFCHGEEHLLLARDSRVTAQAGSKQPVTTLVLPAGQFHQAEE